MVAITMRCPGCNRSMEWIPGWNFKKDAYSRYVTVDRENVNCRLYERGETDARRES
jgi:predicted Fe-S protein YdhL (DUF1289 family)